MQILNQNEVLTISPTKKKTHTHIAEPGSPTF